MTLSRAPSPSESRARRRRRPPLAALSSFRGNRPFQLLWLSNVFFFGGVWTQTLVFGWLAYAVTGSEFLVAVFTAVRLAPLLLGPLAGAFADRHDRVRLLLLACGWAAVASAVVAALVSTERLTYGALLAGGFALGLAQSPSQPARASLVLDLVGREQLSNANALNAMAMNMTQVIGPALGGVMISVLGAPASLWLSALWYIASIMLLLPLRSRVRTAGAVSHESVFTMVTGGLRIISRHRLAVTVLLITVSANITVWPAFQSFMPIFAAETLRLDATGLGMLLTCCGAGGLIGSIIIAALGDFRAKGAMFVIGTMAWAASWMAFSLSRDAATSFLFIGLAGLFSAAFGVLQTTLLLMTTPANVHGRALGVQELAIGMMPLSTLLLGAIAQQVGVEWTTFVSSGLLVTSVGLLALWSPALLRFSGRDDVPAA